jgi:hypothetical protein
VTQVLSDRTKTIVEVTAAIGVLAGLIFVGLELRQNSSAVRAETMLGLNDSTTEYTLLLASDRDLNRLVRKARADLSSLDETESSQFYYLQRTRWLKLQMAYLLQIGGTMDDQTWAFYEQFLCSESFLTDWNRHRSVLVDSFVAVVENCEK